ncbi:MAG: YvcK family protein, partial [Anaerolineaceae bacterium]
RVHKDGSSECPFAEELFADKEAIQRELESLSGQLHKHYETATEELKRCKRNRNVIREDEGQLYGVAAQNAYERAQKASDEEAEKHRRLQRRIVQKQATVRRVLEHARGVSYPRPIRMPPSPRATKRELPPGDIRNCLAALSNDEDLLTQLFQYRFSGSPDLEGHSFGNLFITALADITGSFEDAVVESGRVLSVNGRVLPSTLHNVKLVASMELPHTINEVRVEGESKIPEMTGHIRRVWLEPDDAPAFPPVIKELLNADIIVVGPGSLYTSILPNLLVHDLLSAIDISRAIKIFVCNIATQKGETDAFTCYDHVRALEVHVGRDLFDVILCNDNYGGDVGSASRWVLADEKALSDSRVYCADLIDDDRPWRHDAAKLAQVIVDIFYERTGPLL